MYCSIRNTRKSCAANIGKQKNREVIRQFVDEVLNQGRIDEAGRYFWEDMVEQVPLPGQGPGLAGLQEVLRSMRAAFPDMQWKVLEQIAEDEKVVSRFEWTGTHRATFLGVPATGRSVSVWGVVIDRLQDGKVQDTRIIMDTLGLLIQLGALSPPNS